MLELEAEDERRLRRRRAETSAAIFRLSNELLRDVLDQLDADADRAVRLDRRGYLSQESFRPPAAPTPDQAHDVASFRLTCRRFSALAAVHQFDRVTTRFSRHGFRRLEAIAGAPHLARHVRKFSYMVPYFYSELPLDGDADTDTDADTDADADADAANMRQKMAEQQHILRAEEDVRVLHKAISAFTALQHVQILRVQDELDGRLLAYLRQHRYDDDGVAGRQLQLRWAPACSHSAKTLAAALLAARSPCSRFSSPMLSPQSAAVLAAVGAEPLESFATLAERLTCLELHFDEGPLAAAASLSASAAAELDARMRQLSRLARAVFTAARNMQALHLGFPSHRPVSLPLEDIFHHVRWDKLLAFGLQAWRLNAAEIIHFAWRHRDRLRGLRLRDVLLRPGSRWCDVLAFLRADMPRLDWVSLRRIGYADHFDRQWAGLGAEVPDDAPGEMSDSDDDYDDDATLDVYNDLDAQAEQAADGSHTAHTHTAHTNTPLSPDQPSTDDTAASSLDSSPDSSLDSDDGHGPDENDIDFALIQPDTPSSSAWCTCSAVVPPPLSSADDLGDDGVFVPNAQRKLWERWVVNRCPEHNHRLDR